MRTFTDGMSIQGVITSNGAVLQVNDVLRLQSTGQVKALTVVMQPAPTPSGEAPWLCVEWGELGKTTADTYLNMAFLQNVVIDKDEGEETLELELSP